MNPLSIVVNGITIALSLAFVLIMVWYDLRRHIYQYFVLLLFFVIVWNLGDLANQFSRILDAPSFFVGALQSVGDVGFIGATIALYALTMSLLGFHTNRFRLLILLTLVLIIAWHIALLIVIETPTRNNPNPSMKNTVFIIFGIITSYTLWRYRKRVSEKTILLSISIILIGQSTSLLNPNIANNNLQTTISAFGILLLSGTLVREELIKPLKTRGNQLEYMHKISVNLTKRRNTQEILTEITKQITQWVNADAAIIFTSKQGKIIGTTTYNLPEKIIETESSIIDIATKTITTHKSIRLNKKNEKTNDQITGSAISVPLQFEKNIYGALIVLTGKQGRNLNKEDEYLAEMLAAQAALSLSQAELINEQRELNEQVEQTLNQLSTVLESTENPVLAVDRQLKLIFANRASQRILKTTALHQPIEQNVIDRKILPTPYRDAYRMLREKNTLSYEFTLNERDYLCHITSLGIQRIEGWVIVVNDITEIKELDRIKSEMVRMTSHDLKNPLQAALANIDLLREDTQKLNQNIVINKGELCLSIDNIEREMLKMNKIISGILDLERVRLAKANFENKKPMQIITDAIEEIQSSAEEKRIKIQYTVSEDLPEILCDSQQMQRALVNLLENAIKFSQPNSTIHIHANKTTNKKEKSIYFDITDEGIGIPLEIQPHIFERFYRGEQNGTKHISGSGLGLSLVKEIIKAHNGTISVTSSPQEGSTFTIELPYEG